MTSRILFIVSSDPRASARPAEAIRIAAGLSVWKKVAVQFYLRGHAILAAGESTEGLIDEDNYNHYWPVLAESVASVYVQKNAAALRNLGETILPLTEITDQELAELAALQTSVLRF